jgi:undecaprenyl-diphosphatase
LEKYLAIDKIIFLFVQDYLRNPFLDLIIPFLRNKYFWLPIYLLVLHQIFTRQRHLFIKYFFFLLGLISITDFFNSSLLKNIFCRIRPCNDKLINTLFEPLVPCGSGFSFPSSHAVNHFALAAFFYYTTPFIPIKWRFIWYIWAFSISFAQVYVGVHYPSDVILGGFIGFYFGNIVAKIYLRMVNNEMEIKG